MKFFNKISSNANKLFNKIQSDAPSIYRKFNNTIRKTDNTIQKIGSFLSNTSRDLGQPMIANTVDGFTSGVRNTRKIIQNNLEKAIGNPSNQKTIKDPNSIGGHENYDSINIA